MAYEVAVALSLISIVGVLAYFYQTLQSTATNDHVFLKIIFFVLCFPALAGIAYYAKVLATDAGASATQISILTTFYKFSILMVIIMYSYVGLRSLLWMLSKFKTERKESWEAKDEIV